MFIGEYTHTVDPKKRLSVPSKFRQELGKRMVVTHGLNKCLAIYPMARWKETAEKLAKLSMGRTDTRAFSRFMLAGAVEVEIDQIGRVLLPDFLKSFAGIKEKVVLAGVYDRVEVWDEKSWSTYKSQIAKDADAMAEKLGESGVF
jgi:MraZ protein